MRHCAYVVNTGIITAIGNSTQACLQSLVAGKHGIGYPTILKTYWQNELPVGEVNLTNEQLAAIIGAPADWPRTALLSAVAVQEALAPYSAIPSHLRTGFFSATTVGGMDITEDFYNDYKNGTHPDVQHIAHHECGAVTELVAQHYNLNGFTTTISTACSSSANSIMMAAQMIENGMLDVAVAGGADSLARFTLNGFNTLMILDKGLCTPFDQNRKGLNLGEGAAYVVLMSEAACKHYNAHPIAIVSGYANTNDAYHQTASSPDGVGNKMAMQQAVQQAGVLPEDISYINLHGTGTANNDSSEGKAIEQVFEGNIPMASSTKAYTGHTLGAAGGVEAVFSVLSIQQGIVYPNLRWHTPMEDIGWQPQTTLHTGLQIRHVLSNSFGFGGNCSSLVFSEC